MRTTRSNRRTFCKAVAGSSIPYLVPAGLVAGANDQIRVGLIGCGVRGKYLIANLPETARVVSLCDCSLDNVANTRHPVGSFTAPLARFAEGDAQSCSVYQDYRRMLDRESLDAVLVATPDHHHAQAMVLACQAGMDVYCEKPLSLTIAEGRTMVQAAEQNQRVVQVGSQQRTMRVNQVGCEFIRQGGLGRVSLVRVPNFPGPMTYDGSYPEESVPDGMNWQFFCGPTELRPYNHRLWIKDAFKFGYLTWRGWDLFRSYSGHLVTNWGAHSIDMVQYALGADHTGPVEIWLEPEVLRSQGRYIDDQWHDKTPPLGTVGDKRLDSARFCPLSMRYANGTVLSFDPTAQEIVFHGERGKLFMSRNRFRTEPADLAPQIDPQEQARWLGAGHVARPHLANWLESVRARSVPNAPVEVGHRTATVCHLANLVRELGRRLQWDPDSEQFVGDQEANTRRSRPRRAGFELG